MSTSTMTSSGAVDSLRQLRRLVVAMSVVLAVSVAAVGWLIAKSGLLRDTVDSLPYVTPAQLNELQKQLNESLAKAAAEQQSADERRTSELRMNRNETESLRAEIGGFVQVAKFDELERRLTATANDLRTTDQQLRQSLQTLPAYATPEQLRALDGRVTSVTNVANNLTTSLRTAEQNIANLRPILNRVTSIENTLQNGSIDMDITNDRSIYLGRSSGGQPMLRLDGAAQSSFVLTLDSAGLPYFFIHDRNGSKRLELGQDTQGHWCFFAYPANSSSTNQYVCSP
jgi:hypothetical protein